MPAQPAKVLLVDDEPKIRLTFRAALETEGWEVVEANGGRAALESLNQQAFDAAILDLQMPAMDGISLLRSMREFDLVTPVIIVTAYGDLPNAVEAMRYGAIDFLSKPIVPDALRKLIKEVLDRKHPAVMNLPKTDFESHLRVAKRLLNLRKFDGAKEHLIRALDIEDQSPDAFNLAGVLFEMQEDYDRAKRYYKQALRLDKDHEAAQGNMRRMFELFHFGSSDEPFYLGRRKSRSE